MTEEKKGNLLVAMIVAVLAFILMLGAMGYYFASRTDAQKLQDPPKLEKIIVYSGKDLQHIELIYNNSQAFFLYIGFEQFKIFDILGVPDAVWAADDRVHLGYKEAGLIFILDKKKQHYIQQIIIYNPCAETNKGVKIGDTFQKARELYGKPQEDYNPYNDPRKPELNNNRLMVYKRIGILFYGAIAPDVITSFALFEGH